MLHINMSISTSTKPTIWKHAKVSPVFNSRDSSEPGNYCPISILPVLSKILEKAIHKKLMEYLETENLLCSQQYGFRHKWSMKMAATLFYNRIHQQMYSGKLVGNIYLDLTKAFETIVYNVLIDKLPKFGICGESLHWFVDYLFNRSQTFEINDCRSVVEPIVSGVLQGFVLGLLLFIMFYNDFSDQTQSYEVIMYADNTVIFYANKDPTVIDNQLNKEKEYVKNYSFTNEHIINAKKGETEVMLFGTVKRLKLSRKKLEVTFFGKQINFVSNYKYLGVVINDTMTLNDKFNRTYKAASTRLQLLGKIKSSTTVKVRCHLYTYDHALADIYLPYSINLHQDAAG